MTKTDRRFRRCPERAICIFIDDIAGVAAEIFRTTSPNSSLTGLGMMMGAYRFTRQPHRPMVD